MTYRIHVLGHEEPNHQGVSQDSGGSREILFSWPFFRRLEPCPLGEMGLVVGGAWLVAKPTAIPFYL